MNIANRIKLIREQLGLTQNSFAKSVKVSQNNISEIEGNKRKPSGPLLLALEHKHGINHQWLENGKGNKYITEKINFTTQERKLIQHYRQLPNNHKKTIQTLITSLNKK